MTKKQHVFGVVPSRRLGRSLGISPIPGKTCNYSCVYCQLGRTNRMTNRPQLFFSVAEILDEFKSYQKEDPNFDIVTIVGEGEPTLYAGLKELIQGLHECTDKPVAIITNAALFYDPSIRDAVKEADMVLPSMDYCNEETFRKIDRPYGTLKYEEVYQGLIDFSKEYQGRLDLEIMLVRDMNDSEECLLAFKEALKPIRYDALSINTPVRPPAESFVQVIDDETMKKACDLLQGMSIEVLTSGAFSSGIEDDYEAILSIITRHPMNQHEVKTFLDSRNNQNYDSIIQTLMNDERVEHVHYKGYDTFRYLEK